MRQRIRTGLSEPSLLDNAISTKLSHEGTYIRARNDFFSFYFSTKTYVVGIQKNRLNETVLLSTQNICLNRLVRKF